MVDRYTKGVLTVIAAALVGLLIQNATSPATAQNGGCGRAAELPCNVRVSNVSPIEVGGTVAAVVTGTVSIAR